MLKTTPTIGWARLGNQIATSTVLAAAITALVGCGSKIVNGGGQGSGVGNISGETVGEPGGTSTGDEPVVGGTGGTGGSGGTGGAGGEVPVSGISGACIVRDDHTDMPDFDAPDVGPGYAKQAIPGVNDIEGLKAACTSAIYTNLFGLHCAESGTWAQAEVVTYSAAGTPDTTTCGLIGCEFVNCP